MLRRQLRSQENVGFPSESVYCREGIETTEVHRIHLHYLSGCRCLRYRPSFLVLPPPGADDILLSQNLIDLGDRQVDAMLQTQEVLDLLATTVKFPFPQLPHQPLHHGIYPSASPLAFLGLVVFIQKAQQPTSFDALYPEMDCLSMLTQPLGYACLRHPLLVQLPA